MNKQLEAVSREFETWRNQRKKRTHTPEALIAKAVALRESCSEAHIVKALKINSTVFKQWVQRNASELAETFVELPTQPVKSEGHASKAPSADDNSTLQVGLPSGTTLTLSGNACALANFVTQLASKGAV